MRTLHRAACTAPLAIAALLALVSQARAVGAALTSESRLEAAVEVRDLALAGGTVTGTVVNRSTAELRDVVLQITRAWLWADERNPGPINPGGTYYYTLPATIAPGAAAKLSYRLPEVDAPADLGSFRTTATVVGYTEVTYAEAPRRGSDAP